MPESVWHAIGRYFLLFPEVELFVSAVVVVVWLRHVKASMRVLLSTFVVAVAAHLFIFNDPLRMEPLEPQGTLIDDLKYYQELFPSLVPQTYSHIIRRMPYKELLDSYGSYTVQFAHHSAAIIVHFCILRISGAIRSIEKAQALGVMLDMIKGECSRRFRGFSAPEADVRDVMEGVVGGILAGCVAAGCTVLHAGLRIYAAIKKTA